MTGIQQAAQECIALWRDLGHPMLLAAARELEDRIAALPAQPQAPAALSPEIAAFALDMQRELDANAHKGQPGSWRECSPEWLWNDTMYHAAKMIYAMKHGEADKVSEFAADVANMAMMTRDAYLAQAREAL